MLVCASVTNRSMKILELVNYREDNGDKTRSPLSTTENALNEKKGLSGPIHLSRFFFSFPSTQQSNSADY